VDGLFCALIASPESVSPSEYLPVILGGDLGSSQVFADLDVSGDPIVVVFSRFEHRRFFSPYSSAEIYLNRFLHVDFVAAAIGAQAAPGVAHG